jgi:peptide chain release factor 1
VLDLIELPEVSINFNDVEVTTTKGSGPGGQNRNKVETVVVLKHKSGLTVRCGSERSQYQNKQLAFEILYSKLQRIAKYNHQKQAAQNKRLQMGSGHRAEKIRTYMVKHNLWIDHRTNERRDLKAWIKGKW